MTDQQIFYNECVIGNTWSQRCSSLLRANADQQWLQTYVYDIFKQQVPYQNLANPVPNKIVGLTPDCLFSPEACQQGLNWSCANSTAESYNKYNGFTAGIANRLCGCFSLPAGKSWQTNCYCQNSVPNLSQPLCLAHICQIDNVSVTLINSQSGDINLQQACGGYNLQTRSFCDISNINIYVEDSSIGSVILQQQCLTSPPNIITLNGDTQIVNQTGVTTSQQEQQDTIARPSWLITVLVIILALFVILSIIAIVLFIKDIPTYRLIIDNSIT